MITDLACAAYMPACLYSDCDQVGGTWYSRVKGVGLGSGTDYDTSLEVVPGM